MTLGNKSVGTTELHCSTKKREHSFSILKESVGRKKAFSMLKECSRFFVLQLVIHVLNSLSKTAVGNKNIQSLMSHHFISYFHTY